MESKVAQTNSARQWIGLIVVYLLIPLVLFVCAGDFAWWQGWGYALLIFAAGVGGRILSERRHPGLTAERQNVERMQEAGLDHRFGWSPVFPLWLILLGFFLIAFGYAFGVWAIMENRFFSGVVRIQTDRGHAVCDTGPYGIVRHPGYGGNILPLLGIVLALSSLWTIIPAVAALIIALIRTTLEDRTLQKELPGYREYVQRVRYRWFPGIY